MNPDNAARKPTSSLYLPIRSLGPQHRERICAHLLALNEQDRYLRFGYPAGDAQIRRYVDSMNLGRDDVFGIFNRKLELVAMAHLAYALSPDCSHCAEFGVSVSGHARGRGYGARLFERATMHARNEGVDLMFIHALSENTAMLNIARKAGARLVRDGSETEAFLQLPPANFDSVVTELVQEQVAQTDYRLKRQAYTFMRVLALLQDIRKGVQNVGEGASV
ncbi:MAG TPA: GNAT family N-acetyltransferase [Burkholderiaceae bacterium]|nr:GNAT family N-acetyltransferase [Burkholderiaceae bacterium]